MPLKVIETSLPGVLLIEPPIFRDARGFFMEIYHQGSYAEAGMGITLVQDNYSHSKKGTLRGLHYQLRHPQAKLVFVLCGEIYDVVVDIRRGSPTFGKWVGTYLSSTNRLQIFVPQGFAHGFCVLSDTADVLYKCGDFYAPGDEYGIFWADPDIGIRWPVTAPLLSEKDQRNPLTRAVPGDCLPMYKKHEG